MHAGANGSLYRLVSKPMLCLPFGVQDWGVSDPPRLGGRSATGAMSLGGQLYGLVPT